MYNFLLMFSLMFFYGCSLFTTESSNKKSSYISEEHASHFVNDSTVALITSEVYGDSITMILTYLSLNSLTKAPYLTLNKKEHLNIGPTFQNSHYNFPYLFFHAGSENYVQNMFTLQITNVETGVSKYVEGYKAKYVSQSGRYVIFSGKLWAPTILDLSNHQIVADSIEALYINETEKYSIGVDRGKIIKYSFPTKKIDTLRTLDMNKEQHHRIMHNGMIIYENDKYQQSVITKEDFESGNLSNATSLPQLWGSAWGYEINFNRSICIQVSPGASNIYNYKTGKSLKNGEWK